MKRSSNAPSPRFDDGLLVLVRPSSNSEPIRLNCRVAIETTGELEERTVRMDMQARVAQDNAMTFTDGATSPLAANVEEFVAVEGQRATLGNRTKIDGRMVGILTVDLLTGGCTFVSRSIEVAGRGTCHSVHAAHCMS